jgi:hypothetical protein
MNSTRSNQVKTSIDDLELFDTLQRGAIRYFIDNVNPANGLVADSTWEGAPSSIAAVGLALASSTVAVERGLMTRAEAIERTLTTLRFFHNSAQGPEPGWMSKNYYRINEGPNVLMIENFRTGLVWRLLKLCPYLVEELHRAGFKGGWLDES